MPKRREFPDKWLPNHERPDRDCTLLELWSRYFTNIAIFRNFQSPEETCAGYTATLTIIETALSEKPARNMTAFDCWDAVQSVLYKTKGMHAGEPYSTSTLLSRLTVIRDIYLFAEARAICCNPLWIPPWELIGEKGIDFSRPSDEIREALHKKVAAKKNKPRYLTLQQERRLVHKIVEHIGEDGRWLGLAIYLYVGVRPAEGRGILMGDFVPFTDYPDRRYINLYKAASEDGTRSKKMKTKTSYRRVPEHIELHEIMKMREKIIVDAMGTADIGELPAICVGNDFSKPCTDTDMSTFAKQELLKLLGNEELSSIALEMYTDEEFENEMTLLDDKDDLSAQFSLSTYSLRKNFATKECAETLLSDTQVRLEMGHKLDDPLRYPYAESDVYEMLLAGDHRMIEPSLRSDWYTVLGANDDVEIRNAGKHFLLIPKDVVVDGIEIDIDIESLDASDKLIMELYRRLPAETEMLVEEKTMPASIVSTERVNTDYEHWPVTWRKQPLNEAVDSYELPENNGIDEEV